MIIVIKLFILVFMNELVDNNDKKVQLIEITTHIRNII